MPILSQKQAVTALLNSEIVAFPTETVYGLGAVASDALAVENVFLAKSRPKDNPLICHFYDLFQIQKYADFPAEYVVGLLQHFSPGPISLLLPVKTPNSTILKPALAGLDQIVCRIPRHDLTLDLLKEINIPLVGPSANLSSRPSGTSAEMVLDQLGRKIAGVLDGGICQIGLESTILDCRQSHQVTILRPGSVGMSELKTVLNSFGVKVFEKKAVKNTNSDLVIPGAKYPHYSPKTPITHISKLNDITKTDQKILVIASQEKLSEIKLSKNTEQVFDTLSLGSKFNLKAVAQNLYQNLNQIDALGFDQAYLVDENWGDQSLAMALQNRLNKVGVKPV